jgi:hypothetical protein
MGPIISSGSYAQERLLSLSGIEPRLPGRKIRNLVTAMTELSRLPLFCKSVKCIVTCMSVTIDGVWIHNQIYWTYQHTTRDYTLQITVTHRLVFSVTVFIALLGNGFQQWTFICSRVHVLACWRPCHNNFLLIQLPSQDYSVIAVGPLYITSTLTAQKTPLQTFTPFSSTAVT